jgi:enoyl-CoA hydratase/carnithine racemase
MSELLFHKEGNIGVIKFNRPEVLNSVDTPTVNEFDALLTERAGDPDLRCVILTGEGRAFCCGADINEEAAKNVLER